MLLPVAIAATGSGIVVAAAAVLAMLVWRVGLALAGFVSPAAQPDVVLESISASHFVEKVRWTLDRLGLDYAERPAAGAIGAFFAGRTVPRLNFRSGAVRSSIGNSAEIMRYLWGRYGELLGERAEFLRPTAARTEFEARIDRVGVDLQVWVYHHLLGHRELTLKAWGYRAAAVPGWQRALLPPLLPLLQALIRRSFRITPGRYAKAVEHIDELLSDSERRLSEHPESLLGETGPSYVDYWFAAANGLWLAPENYGSVAAIAVRIERAEAPAPMRHDIERWCERYPLSVAFIERLYAEERRERV